MGLAGKASANNVNCREGGDGADIGVASDMRPVPFENGATERIELHLPDHAQPGALEPEVEAADAGEQTAHGQDSVCSTACALRHVASGHRNHCTPGGCAWRCSSRARRLASTIS